jgi:aryl sulfotransferase
MPGLPVRYRSPDEDSARWDGFAFRPGDIVISTRSKCGTTWMQMICALLIFQSPEPPAPLASLSPWLDWLVTPRDMVLAQLSAQRHRRFIKTHTPLDGVPADPRVNYIVVARHPLDAAVSLYHHGANIDRARWRQLTGQPAAAGPEPPRPPLRDWLRAWIGSDADPQQELDSLPGVMHHLSDAWARRRQPNVVLVHYADLRADLDGEMRSVAARLGISVPEPLWPSLAKAASFESMRAAAGRRIPDQARVLKSPAAFFRRGGAGEARQLLAEPDLARYHARAAQLAAPDLLAWLHREPDLG